MQSGSSANCLLVHASLLGHMLEYISNLLTPAASMCVYIGWRTINRTIYFCCQILYFCNKTRKYDNVHVAPRTLVKAVLSVSSTCCNNERQSFAKLSYSANDNILTNLLPAALQLYRTSFRCLTSRMRRRRR